VRQPNLIELKAATPQVMQRLGRALGRALASSQCGPVVIGIEGELGAGKTTLVASVLASFGVGGSVRSPTYTLVEPYEVPGRTIYHLDLYRLTDPRELEALAVREMLSDRAVLLIEWPSRAEPALPPRDVDIAIEYEEAGGRVLKARANTAEGESLVRAVLAAKPEQRALST
jgi:tRNA threonylcarbamoyladenosine biosynthesis protein TsaE